MPKFAVAIWLKPGQPRGHPACSSPVERGWGWGWAMGCGFFPHGRWRKPTAQAAMRRRLNAFAPSRR
eukprot:16429015-Heterocapsa_arctica.AAC.1